MLQVERLVKKSVCFIYITFSVSRKLKMFVLTLMLLVIFPYECVKETIGSSSKPTWSQCTFLFSNCSIVQWCNRYKVHVHWRQSTSKPIMWTSRTVIIIRDTRYYFQNNKHACYRNKHLGKCCWSFILKKILFCNDIKIPCPCYSNLLWNT